MSGIEVVGVEEIDRGVDKDMGGGGVGSRGGGVGCEMSLEVGIGLKPCRRASALAARRGRP